MKKTYGSIHVDISEVDTDPLRVDHEHDQSVTFRLIDDAGTNVWFNGTAEDWRNFAAYVSRLADQASPTLPQANDPCWCGWVDRADFEESHASDEVTS